MAIIKKMNKCRQEYGGKGTLIYCWREHKLVQPLWKSVWRCLRELIIEVPYNPAIPLSHLSKGM
jgi:hypothetical protein